MTPDAADSEKKHGNGRVRLLWWMLLSSLLLMVLARLLGPSALHRFDQPRTVAYTASMLVNHQWLLPDDVLGTLSTKPVLVNWLAAPVVALGFWTEWAVKTPMLLGSLLTLWLTVHLGRRLLSQCPETSGWAVEGGLLAGLAWLTTPGTMDAFYHCRPDPFLVTCLTAAWAFAVGIMRGAADSAAWMRPALWAVTGLAGLTKGPPMLLPMLYVPLATLLLKDPKEHLQATGWRWGMPLALGILGLWLVPVAVLHWDHFEQVLVGKEFLHRVAGVGNHFGDVSRGGGKIALLTGLHKNPVWLMQKMLPWSLAAAAALWMIRPRQWFHHPLAPAILWVLLVLGFFSLTVGKTADYILPAYPAMAILAAYGCLRACRRFAIHPRVFGLVGLALAAGLSVQSWFFSSAAAKPYGDNLRKFADQVAAKVESEPVAFVLTGYNTLQFFLHRHQPGRPSEAVLQAARWLVMPVVPGLEAELVSDKLPGIHGSQREGVLGLYRSGPAVLEAARQSLQKALAASSVPKGGH